MIRQGLEKKYDFQKIDRDLGFNKYFSKILQFSGNQHRE